MSGGIVAGIQEAGVNPNRATWSTLLKCLDANSKEQNIARTMDLISSLDEPMDEVLLLCTDLGCSVLLPKCHPLLKLTFER